MKLLNAFVGMAAVACVAVLGSAILRAASSRTALLAKPQMQSMTVVPLRDDAGNLQSLHVTVQYLQVSLKPDGVTKHKHLCPIDIDLIVHSKQRVIVDNKIVELGDCADDILTLVDAIWYHRFPEELPTRRKGAREKGTVISPEP